MFNCGIRVNLRVFDFVVFKGNIQIHTYIYGYTYILLLCTCKVSETCLQFYKTF